MALCLYNTYMTLQRNCLYFALTVKPVPQYAPKFECHRTFHSHMVPIINHWLFKAIILGALVANSILLACQVSNFSVFTNNVM